ncbi:MAG: (Fe-S)-binding protein, partial [Deltaproteobacteria bacterium]|nr:(Fe-S)-binding protein [Deltaproteobacteria bacterium]
VMGECGHAFRSVYDVGNRWLGWKMPPIPVIHSAQFFAELIKDGKIKVASKFDEVVTIQDPCNIVRGRGLHKDLRYVARAFCKDVVEMEPSGEHNFCCCAGGGVINCGPPFKNKRVESNRTKAEQLAGTGVKTIISPCHNCHGGIEDIVHTYKLGMHLKFLGDIIYEHMEKSTAA